MDLLEQSSPATKDLFMCTSYAGNITRVSTHLAGG